MADEQRDQFIERLNRIDRAHAAGQAFAAPGTVSRVAPRKRKRYRLPILRILAAALLGTMVMKVAIFGIIGASEYEQRLGALRTEGTAGQALVWVFQADPLTRRAGGLIATLMP